MTDFRALCEELNGLLEYISDISPHLCEEEINNLTNSARAALAEQPVGPTDEELRELYDEMRGFTRAVIPPADGEVAKVVVELQELAESCDTLAMVRVQRLLTRAATLLQQLSAPTPIPMDKLDRLIALDRDDPAGGSHD